MQKIHTNDLLVMILILVFIFDVNFKQMNTLHWIAASVSIIWVVLLVSRILSSKKGYEGNED